MSVKEMCGLVKYFTSSVKQVREMASFNPPATVLPAYKRFHKL